MLPPPTSVPYPTLSLKPGLGGGEITPINDLSYLWELVSSNDVLEPGLGGGEITPVGAVIV